jgi:hypothetical protein
VVRGERQRGGGDIFICAGQRKKTRESYIQNTLYSILAILYTVTASVYF